MFSPIKYYCKIDVEYNCKNTHTTNPFKFLLSLF